MPSLIVFLLLSQTVPPQDYVGKVPNFPLHQHRIYLQAQKIPESQQYSNLLGQRTCFTMRSYVFRRQDGNAPVLVGTTTCTPANTLRMERTVNAPRVRLVPADSPGRDEQR
jgi:hypothetical protein